jgi:transcriptional regulator with XRE-family HTH domain
VSVFSERLKQIRAFRGVTQARLAEAVGITDRACRRYEAGENEPTLSVLEAMADFFGVSADYLLGRDKYWQGKGGRVTAKTPPEIFTSADIARLAKKRKGPPEKRKQAPRPAARRPFSREFSRLAD